MIEYVKLFTSLLVKNECHYLKICFPKHIITKQPQILNYGCKKRMRIYYAIISVPSRNVTLISFFLPTVTKSTRLHQSPSSIAIV